VVARIEPSDPSFLDVRSAAEARASLDAAAAGRTHAAAQVDRAQAELDFARAELERMRALSRSHTVSANDLDAAERRAKTTEAALAEARAERQVRESEYQVARARLMAPGSTRSGAADCACITVVSPVDGRVLRILTESESVVPAGAPLVEVGSPEQLEVVVDLLSADAVRVQPGQRVIIEAWGGDRPLAGQVRRIEPFGFTKVSALGIEEQRVNVLIDIASPAAQWQDLGDAYRVDARIVVDRRADAIVVPTGALSGTGRGGRCSSPRATGRVCATWNPDRAVARRRSWCAGSTPASRSSSIRPMRCATAFASDRASTRAERSQRLSGSAAAGTHD
jgi:HlyD family secretion protein